MKKQVILLQVAMKVECDWLLKQVTAVEKEISGYLFYEWEMKDKFVVLSLSGVGIIAASASFSVAIEHYHPDFVINYGVAVAMTDYLHIGDVVVATQCININSYRTPFRGIGEGSNSLDWNLLTFLSGEEDRFISYDSSKWLLKLVRDNFFDCSVFYGVIGSGDVWNQELDRILFLNQSYGVLASDMEACATYTIARSKNIPVISFKMISDNSLLGEAYDRTVSENLQRYVLDYLEVLVNI